MSVFAIHIHLWKENMNQVPLSLYPGRQVVIIRQGRREVG